MNSKITEIFYLADVFCKEFDKARAGHILNQDTTKKSRNRKFHSLTVKWSPFRSCFIWGIIELSNISTSIIYKNTWGQISHKQCLITALLNCSKRPPCPWWCFYRYAVWANARASPLLIPLRWESVISGVKAHIKSSKEWLPRDNVP